MARVAGRSEGVALVMTPRLEVVAGEPPPAQEARRSDLDSGSLAPSEGEAAPSGALRPEQAPSAMAEITDRLRSAIAEAEAAISDLRAIAADMAGASSPVPPRVEQAERWIDTAVARRIANVESSTLYRWARRFDVGEKMPTGQWRFNERKLRALVKRGENVAGGGEVGDGGPLAPER
jgi:hypothetical protein